MSFDNDYTNQSNNSGQPGQEDSGQQKYESDQTAQPGASSQPEGEPQTGYGNTQSQNYYSQSNQQYGYNSQQGSSYGPYSNSSSGNSSQYGGNMQYKWNYDDYQKALQKEQSKDKPRSRKGVKAAVISIGAVLGIAVIGLAGVGVMGLVNNGSLLPSVASSSQSSNSGKNSGTPGVAISETPTSSTSSAVSGAALTTAQIYKKVSPSVVGILSYNLSSVDQSAEGTGIIMSKDGYIITNEHVIDGADKVAVVLPGGTTDTAIDAKVVGKDTRTDLAVLKISTSKTLTPATFGDSTKLEVGATVIAIGNPGGLEFADTLTQGVVSAVNRQVSSESGYTQNCIQTDASINPGNSGGPLVNVYGQVVGITSSKIAETGYEGMGFAIPISTVKPIVDDLVQYGYVKGRVKIGISVTEFSDYQAKIYNMQPGLRVTAVSSDSDAYKQGIKVNDIITKINNVSATSYDKFYAEESKYKAGDTVTITVYRYSTGGTLTFKVKLSEDKGETSTSTQSSSSSSSSSSNSNQYGFGNGSNNDPFSFFNQSGN